MRLRRVILLVVPVWLSALGCGARETEQEFLVKNAVRKYNTALVESYRVGDPSLLEGLATQREIRRVDILIGALQEQNRRLRATLERLDFGAVQVEGPRLARVRTRETWSYEHVDTMRQTPVEKAKRIQYHLLYTLERQGPRWLVTALAPAEEQAGK